MNRQLKISKKITNRESLATEQYLQDIAQIPLLTLDEELALSQKIKSGDKAAFEKLVKANLRFVVSVAKQYEGRGLSLQDLINEGNIGLLKAAERFDETRGFRFISYAVWWIRQAILQALNETGRIVRLPSNKANLVRKVGRIKDQIFMETEYEPSAEDIAEALNLSTDEIETALVLAGDFHDSLDKPIRDDDDTTSTFADMLPSNNISPADYVDREYQSEKIIAILKRELREREYIVLTSVFGFNGSEQVAIDTVAKQLGLTIERARQIKEKAIQHLRSPRIRKKIIA